MCIQSEGGLTTTMMMTEAGLMPVGPLDKSSGCLDAFQGEKRTSHCYINGHASPTYSINLTSFRHDLHLFLCLLLQTAHHPRYDYRENFTQFA